MFLFLCEGWSKGGVKDCGPIVKLKERKISLGKQVFFVEVATTSEQTQRGLMCRKSVKKGMLFVFKKSRPRSFWMKKTFVPLSIGFFDSEKKLINIEVMTPVKFAHENPLKKYHSRGPAQYALEVPAGWFKKKGIKIGERFSLP